MPSARAAGRRSNSRYCRMSWTERPTTPGQDVSANCLSHSIASSSISTTSLPVGVVEQLRLLARTVRTTSNANAMCALSSRNTQFVPGGEAVKQPARAEEVHVGERAEEEEPLDARREADQVQEELPPVARRLEPVQARRSSRSSASRTRAFGRIDGMFSIAANACDALLRIGRRRCRGASGRTARAAPPRRAAATGTSAPRAR